MVRTLDNRQPAGGFFAHPGAAMAADIVKAAHARGLVARDNNAFAGQVSQRSPDSSRSGTVQTTWPTWVFDGVGRTRRSVVLVGVVIASRASESRPTVGFS